MHALCAEAGYIMPAMSPYRGEPSAEVESPQVDAHSEARAHAERERARRREDRALGAERSTREQPAIVRDAAAESTPDLRALARKLEQLARENAELKEQLRDLERRVGELENDREAP